MSKILKTRWQGVVLSFSIGLGVFCLNATVTNPIFDPLLAALIIGSACGAVIPYKDKFKMGCSLVPHVFIPIGVVLYGIVNLDFNHFRQINIDNMFMLAIVFLLYLISALLLSHLLKLRNKTGYLIAAGSAVCGASAITIVSRSIDAEPDDVSESLLPVFMAGILALVYIFPFLRNAVSMTESEYGIFAGTILQFTGFVKSAVAGFSPENSELALTIKAVRYSSLLIIIPLFSSFNRGKLSIPWYLWAFLFSGICLSLFAQAAEVIRPLCRPVLTVLWASAMGAIGIASNIRLLFSPDGFKAVTVSLASCMIVSIIFILGIHYL